MSVLEKLERFVRRAAADGAEFAFRIRPDAIFRGALPAPQEFMDSAVALLLARQPRGAPYQRKLALLEEQLPRGVCGRVLSNEPVVKCFTCSSNQYSVLCLQCFDERAHAGHNFKVHLGNGICDCGCAHYVPPRCFCARHRGLGAADTLATLAAETPDLALDLDRAVAVLVFLVRYQLNFFFLALQDPRYAEQFDYFTAALLSIMNFKIDAIRLIFTQILLFLADGTGAGAPGAASVQRIKRFDAVAALPRYTRPSDLHAQVRMFERHEGFLMGMQQVAVFYMVIDHYQVTREPA